MARPKKMVPQWTGRWTTPVIFVTLGTDYHRFDRLVKPLAALERRLNTTVLLQSGPNLYDSPVKQKKILEFEVFQKKIQQADAIISHGGPGSILSALNSRKVPIVVPRKAYHGEAVDNHQVDFVQFLDEQEFPIKFTLEDKITATKLTELIEESNEMKIDIELGNSGKEATINYLKDLIENLPS